MSIGAGVDLAIEFGQFRDEYRNNRRRDEEKARAMVPFDITLQTSGTCPTPTSPFNLNLGGPDAGYYWLIRRIVVGGLTWATSAAGTAEAYVTGINPISGSVGPPANTRTIVDMVDQSAGLPNKAFYGFHEVVVQANQNLVLVIVTGTAGQVYTAAAGVQVFRTLSAVETIQT